MSDYDFILNDLKFSFSSASTFETCPYSFKLTYIDAMPREDNFYAEFGKLVHECFEEFFTGRIEAFELSGFYRERWMDVIKTPSPVPPYGLDEKYKAQGEEFFDNFDFPVNNYDILLIEEKFNTVIDGCLFTGKPDLLIKNKKTGRTILYDFKTSAPYRVDRRSGKEIEDKKKITGYFRQLYIYANSIKKEKGFNIDELRLLFPRLNRETSIEWSEKEEKEAMLWLTEIIEKAKSEENFPYDKSSPYFCNNLCSVRTYCEYR